VAVGVVSEPHNGLREPALHQRAILEGMKIRARKEVRAREVAGHMLAVM